MVAAWTRAGLCAGTCLGALVGGVVMGAFNPAIVIAAVPIGGVLGGVVGLVVGLLTGAALAALATTPVLGSTAPGRGGRATLAAVLATVIAGLAIQVPLVGYLLGAASDPQGWLLVYLPVALGALVAAALSRRLPPGRAGDHESAGSADASQRRPGTGDRGGADQPPST